MLYETQSGLGGLSLLDAPENGQSVFPRWYWTSLNWRDIPQSSLASDVAEEIE